MPIDFVPILDAASDMLPTLEAPELAFGICSPIGTKNAQFVNILQTALRKYEYKSAYFKVTDLMQSIIIKGMELKNSPSEERYHTHISYANKFCELTGLKGALAMLCTTAVAAFRSKEGKGYIQNQAYIFDQFKRPEEIETLRQTYGRLFVLISLYSEKERRIEYLTPRISRDHVISRFGTNHRKSAEDLVNRDELEQGDQYGQRLSDTFAMADLFLNIDDTDSCERMLGRFLDAFFGSNKISPTKDEYGMYMAKSASLRSLDLSRQVGAAIFSSDGEVLTLGSNEVPKAHGGTYWNSESPDARDYALEGDQNEIIKHGIMADVVRRLARSGFMRKTHQLDDLVNEVLFEVSKKGSELRDAQLMDLLEFGRIIHAEMSAVSDAARLGKATKGATLFCTTFPCHICAKHIVAAGLSRVVYIEPYPKSYAEQLHADSITVTTEEADQARVHFSPFIGISPFRFRDLFERGRRKDQRGNFSEWTAGEPKPLIRYTVASYLDNEIAMNKIIKDNLDKLIDRDAIKIV